MYRLKIELLLSLLLYFIVVISSLLPHSASCTEDEVLFNTNINGLIAAFGDFNSDRFTDVFIITDNGKTLKLLKSYEKKPELREWSNISCSFNHTGDIIVGVTPADFNGDAMMDLMIITQTKRNIDHNINKFNISIFRGDRNNLDCASTKVPLIESASSHPLILDYNGDMIADFIVETDDCPRLLVTHSNTKFKKECLKTMVTNENVKMRFPNSNAFVNIHNCKDTFDFTSDIFISGDKKMEYWYDRGGFTPENIVQVVYPDDKKYIIGQSTFIDLNIDGCIEHIMAVCEILTDSETCDPQILLFNYEKQDWTKISDLSNELNQTDLYFEKIKTVYGFDLPIAVRSGDIDGDGYVDLVAVLKSKTSKKTRGVILKNTKDDSVHGGRKFILHWSSDKLIDDNIELVSFLDVQENGKVDIILTVRDSDNKYNIKWIRNTFMEYSCFLKVLVTSGLCFGVCPNDKVSYGTNQAGPFICYETSDMNGNLIKGCAGQLSQSSHFALQMPYSIFGLGETPNFVETVTASIPSGEIRPVRKSKWTQIVPDAQVVLIPYPPNETIYWISKLFYTPSSIVFSTLLTLAALCCILIIIIIILHRKEILEDLAEHQEYKRHWPESR